VKLGRECRADLGAKLEPNANATPPALVHQGHPDHPDHLVPMVNREPKVDQVTKERPPLLDSRP